MAINCLENVSSGSYTPQNIEGPDTQKSQLYMLNAIQMIAELIVRNSRIAVHA